jgi:hypothetical protein
MKSTDTYQYHTEYIIVLIYIEDRIGLVNIDRHLIHTARNITEYIIGLVNIDRPIQYVIDMYINVS